MIHYPGLHMIQYNKFGFYKSTPQYQAYQNVDDIEWVIAFDYNPPNGKRFVTADTTKPFTWSCSNSAANSVAGSLARVTVVPDMKKCAVVDFSQSTIWINIEMTIPDLYVDYISFI